jgi:hypothetical protein
MKCSNTETRPLVPMNVAEEEVQEIICHIDRAAQERASCSHLRSEPRIPFRRNGVVLSLTHPGQSESVFLVCTRNISRGGIGVLLGAFVHPGTRCEVELPSLDGLKRSAFGIVQWCRLVRGIIHEVGIRFEQGLEVEQFINIATLRMKRSPQGQPVDSSGRELRQNIRKLTMEFDRLIRYPRLTRGLMICQEVRENADELNWQDLSEAALKAIEALTRTGSIARSKELLRNVQKISLSGQSVKPLTRTT